MKTKSFYVISALLQDSRPLGNLRRWTTEKEAINHAKVIIQRRFQEGEPPIPFNVLRVVSVVTPTLSPVTVTKYKGERP